MRSDGGVIVTTYARRAKKIRGGEIMAENENMNTKDFIIGSLVGSFVGAAAALLFAPKSGRELRSDINYGASQAMDRASELKDTAQIRGAEWKDRAVNKGSEWKQMAKDKTTQFTKNGSKKTEEGTNNTQAEVSDIQGKAK